MSLSPKHDHEEEWVEPDYKARTELGKALWEIRKWIVASGQHLLTEEEIEQRLNRNRVDRRFL